MHKQEKYEEAEGRAMTLAEVLSMFNNVINDQEIIELNRKPPSSSSSTKEKKKKEKGREKKTSLVTAAKGSPRTGSSGKRIEKICLLCGDKEHFTRQHHFDKHQQMTVEEVRQKCKEHKLWFKCALPINRQDHTGGGDCANVTQNCFYCSQDDHVNIICPNIEDEELKIGGNGPSEHNKRVHWETNPP